MWGYTLKQLTAYTLLAGRRVKQGKADLLSIQTLAARGESKAVKKTLKDLQK